MAEGLLAGKMRGGLMQNHRVLLEDYHDGSRKKYACVRLRSQAVFFKGLTEQGRQRSWLFFVGFIQSEHIYNLPGGCGFL